jgi:hypothetical protein
MTGIVLEEAVAVEEKEDSEERGAPGVQGEEVASRSSCGITALTDYSKIVA